MLLIQWLLKNTRQGFSTPLTRMLGILVREVNSQIKVNSQIILGLNNRYYQCLVIYM